MVDMCLTDGVQSQAGTNPRDGYGAIIELMKTVGVESWEELKGKCIRAKFDSPFGKVVAIGNLFKDQWFSFEEYFDEVSKKEGTK